MSGKQVEVMEIVRDEHVKCGKSGENEKWPRTREYLPLDFRVPRGQTETA